MCALIQMFLLFELLWADGALMFTCSLHLHLAVIFVPWKLSWWIFTFPIILNCSQHLGHIYTLSLGELLWSASQLHLTWKNHCGEVADCWDPVIVEHMVSQFSLPLNFFPHSVQRYWSSSISLLSQLSCSSDTFQVMHQLCLLTVEMSQLKQNNIREEPALKL